MLNIDSKQFCSDLVAYREKLFNACDQELDRQLKEFDEMVK